MWSTTSAAAYLGQRDPRPLGAIRKTVFVSGLKGERGDAYADFQMDEGIDYRH